MTEVDYLLLNLRTDRPVSLGASLLSVRISARYQALVAASARPLSGGGYPLIQYKVIRGSPLVVAVNEGCDILWEIYDELPQLAGNLPFKILEKRVIERKVVIGPTSDRLRYRFLTPWLTLPEKDIPEREMAPQRRNRFLAGMLQNNILSFAKNFNIPLTTTIEVSLNLKDGHIVQKESGVAGFSGSFHVNFLLPQFLGLGRHVSRGFGTVKQA